ncbi:MAG: 50S ribosomal protein L25/general stress protein Ctc [Alphaproteobacteria bacterium]|nr:50S ribosomal protein L25/general stress protein Ctc [Alphaproteobacteria bacterium]
MSENTLLSADERSRVGKGSARAARRAGKIPAVIYGDKKPAMGIELEARVIRKLIHEPGIFTRLLDIDTGSGKETVLTRDIQMHPVTDEPLHLDFLRISRSATLAVAVGVEFINEDTCPALKIGGVLNVVRHEVELNCPATAIPEKIIVDLEGLKIGDSVHISAIELPEGVTPTIADRDFTIATLASPGGGVKNEEEEAAEAGAEGGEEAAASEADEE